MNADTVKKVQDFLITYGPTIGSALYTVGKEIVDAIDTALSKKKSTDELAKELEAILLQGADMLSVVRAKIIQDREQTQIAFDEAEKRLGGGGK